MTLMPLPEEAFVTLFQQVTSTTLRSCAAAIREQIRAGTFTDADWEVLMYQMATVISEMDRPQLREMLDRSVASLRVDVQWPT